MHLLEIGSISSFFLGLGGGVGVYLLRAVILLAASQASWVSVVPRSSPSAKASSPSLGQLTVNDLPGERFTALPK